ncbi:hypothetical protein ABE85_20570 [Mitsuaria sp. 7]|nr:hypothetical protein ABE85_20570 [Mitsuaria sp. 7]
MPPPDPQDVTPVALWPTPETLEVFLLDLSHLPTGANRSPAAVRETERIYDLASPIKRLLDESEPYPDGFTLRDRVSTIAAAVRYGHLHTEHARRLLVPSEPSWLTRLNTSWRVRLAHDTLQTLAHGLPSRDGSATTAAGKSLFLQVLEVRGDSPSQVLLSMNLFYPAAHWLPRLDRAKAALADRLVTLMYHMEFTDAEIGPAQDVPRKRPPPAPPWFFGPRA